MNDVVADAIKPFVFNNQQQAAMEDIVRWYGVERSRKREYSYDGSMSSSMIPYLLQGYAGTGKTTLVKTLLEMLNIPLSRIALVAPTNRAAKVLANKTGLMTRTLFSLIYSSQREELEFQRQKLRSWDEAANFSQLGDLLIKCLDVDLDAEFEEEWMESGADGDYVNDTPEYRQKAYDEALEKFKEGRRITILMYEDIQLPEDAGARLELFEVMKAERMKSHKDQIREILAQDMPTRKKEASEIVAKHDVIICDEASMVNAQQGKDLCSYGVPVILVGDPFQLQPVKAKAFWDDMKAQTVLTKIERQKGLGAGIPLAGERLRTGKEVVQNESVGIWTRNQMPEQMFLDADQILVGTHKTRERLCRFIRKLRGYDEFAHPQVGEKVVAVYNDKPAGIMNGELYEVMASDTIRGGSVTVMTIKDPYGRIINDVRAWTKGFPGRSQTDFLDDAFGKFWFGYAITCHQSQGSEWKSVIVCDDWPKNDIEGWKRWLYTGLTRASQRVEWIRG